MKLINRMKLKTNRTKLKIDRRTLKIAAAIFLTPVMAGLLFGCAPAPTPTDGNDADVMNIVALADKAFPEPKRDERDSDAQTALRGMNDFAFELSAGLAANITDESFVCSPYSVWLPLAALVNATAEGGARDALLDALSAGGIESDGINRAASKALYDLTKQSVREYSEERGEPYHTPLRIANAIFIDKDATLRDEFAQAFTENYRGVVAGVDFSSEDAADAVNRWASENTEGLISNLVSEFDPKTVSAIASAIYYFDKWRLPFNPKQTVEGTFSSPSGDTPAYYMLREGDQQVYYEDDKVQAMPLEFNTGGRLYVILPKSGDAVELLSSMTAEYFAEIRRDSIIATGRLELPRFKIESDARNLKETLTEMGVPLFDAESAPLTGGLIKEDIPVWLSGAAHKAVIEVDEKGTTAAAVTTLDVAGAAMPVPTEPFSMVCDRPFVFILCENVFSGFTPSDISGEQVLFTGIVNLPNE